MRVALLSLLVSSLFATQAAAQQAQRIEKIEVTGSNIKRIDAETVAPVAVITREEIERTGKLTISEVLRSIPQNAGASFNDTFTNSFSPGASGISLRGLGQKSTLVLVNGRRMAGYGFAQNIFDTYVDINAIPASAVERIEVLKDGASAVYGSDAIAGVVNIILRRNYQGGEVSGAAGTSHEGGLDEQRASIGAGFGDLSRDRYNVLATLDWYKRDQLLASERETTASQDFRHEVGGLLGFGTRAAYVRPTGTNRVPFPDCAPGVRVPASQLNAALTGESCAYNPAAYLPLFPATERLGALARGTFEFSPALQAFFELTYSDNETFQTLTPGQVSTANITFDPVTGGVRTIPGALPVGNPSNPFGATTPFIYTFFDVGPRDALIESKSWRALGGLKGTFGKWDWETGVGKADSTTDQYNFNGLRTSVVQSAIANGTYNFLNPSAGTVTAELLRVNYLRKGTSELDFFDVKASTELAQLPGGPLGFAVGFERRREAIVDESDDVLNSGEVLGRGFTRVRGERTSKAAFAELVAPFTRQVEAQLAVRHDSYSDFGSATSPKGGVKWAPSRDVLFRASLSRGFRAPTLPEAAESNAISFITVRDPNFNNAQVGSPGTELEFAL